jgi:hypothetical protein
MKTLLMSFALVWGVSAFAGPPPQQEQDQDQQQQDQQQCRYNCQPPRPQVYTCHAIMVDCYGRPLYTYWARGPHYQGACQFAANLCVRDARMGYGGAGARCTILGK